MAGMVSTKVFAISLFCLVGAICGLLGLVFIAFRFFTYQGTGMDWIYPAAGLCVLLWMGSAWTTVTRGVAVIGEYLYRRRPANRKLEES